MIGQAAATFGNTVPGAEALAQAVLQSPAIQALNQTLWLFSLVEVAHLLFLTIIGGSTLVLALRTLGVTLREVPLSHVERLTRPWLRAGTIGGITSGVFLSVATILTLVGNSAFFAKIIALTAAILFSFALSRRLRGGGAAAQFVLAGVGVVLLGTSLWLFASTDMLEAGATLLGAIILLFGVLVGLSKWRVSGAGAGNAFAQILAIGTVVSWLTVALGGRWIGFS